MPMLTVGNWHPVLLPSSAARQVPGLDRAVPAGGDQFLACGRELCGKYVVRVAFEMVLHVLVQVEEANDRAGRTAVANPMVTGGQPSTVWGEGQVAQANVAGTEHAPGLLAHGVPQLDGHRLVTHQARKGQDAAFW